MTFFENPVVIAGAGMSGATLARALAEKGIRCIVLEERSHVAGNCHTEIDAETGILIHRYGPHIFHTDDERVWQFLSKHTDFVPYRHQVLTISGGKIYSLPINLLTINQFFGTSMMPDEARKFVHARTLPIVSPINFEEQALSTIGPELYAAFFRDYTVKQWGMQPCELPAAVLKRLPIRFNYDGSYFHHARQAMPRDGYTALVSSLLNHANIEVRLNQVFDPSTWTARAPHVFYTGMLDRYFGFRLGRLPYRTLDFEELRTPSTLQGTAVMNYGDNSVPWTRITEHKFLSPWSTGTSEASVSFREHARACGPSDIPYYPIHLAGEHALLRRYLELGEAAKNVTFLGRLGNYAYLDMDAAVKRALETADAAIAAWKVGTFPPAFVHRLQ